MSWSQLAAPNLGITYTGGWCLKAVEDAFNTEHLYPSAMDSWNAGNGNHPGEQPPAGVAVPVYFTLGSTPAGHIAISLPDGRVASSTQEGTHQGLYIHPTLQDLINIYTQYDQGCTYLGWSERLANTQIVADQGAANDMDTHQIAKDLYLVLTGSVPGDDIINQKADFMTATGNCQQVAKDILQAGIDGNEIANVWALTNYDEARGGDNPAQFAQDRWFGHDSFSSVIKRDMPGYIQAAKNGETAQASVTSLQGQLERADNTITDLQNELKQAQDQLHTAPQPSAPAPTIDCSAQAQAAAQAALQGVKSNPWPYVWQWFKGGGK